MMNVTDGDIKKKNGFLFWHSKTFVQMKEIILHTVLGKVFQQTIDHAMQSNTNKELNPHHFIFIYSNKTFLYYVTTWVYPWKGK